MITPTPSDFRSHSAAVEALLYRPPHAAGPSPAVVLSPGRSRDIDGLAWLASALAEAGNVVLAHRYRDGDVRYYERDAEDIEAAVALLAARADVDGGRIGLIGHSRGGMASLLASAAADHRVRATVCLCGPTDHTRMVAGLEIYAPSRHAEMIHSHAGGPADAADYYQAISAVNHAAEISAPVLLVYGGIDLVCPLDHGIWMRDALLAAGKAETRLEIIPGMGHFFEQGTHGYLFDRVAALARDWFAAHLL